MSTTIVHGSAVTHNGVLHVVTKLRRNSPYVSLCTPKGNLKVAEFSELRAANKDELITLRNQEEEVTKSGGVPYCGLV